MKDLVAISIVSIVALAMLVLKFISLLKAIISICKPLLELAEILLEVILIVCATTVLTKKANPKNRLKPKKSVSFSHDIYVLVNIQI